MHEPFAEPTDAAAGQLHVGMIGRPDVTAQIATKKPQAVIVLPRAEANRVPQEMVEPADAVAVVLRPCEHLRNLGGNFRCDAFVGIEDQHPRVGRLRNRPVLEIARRAILALDDAATQGPRDLKLAIG